MHFRLGERAKHPAHLGGLLRHPDGNQCRRVQHLTGPPMVHLLVKRGEHHVGVAALRPGPQTVLPQTCRVTV